MIYTLTLNPSLDYIVELDNIHIGELNRTKAETKLPGGKGINVSIVLNKFEIESRALGFIGGFTGKFIEDFLQKEHIATNFVQVQEDTRINVKLKSTKETEVNAKGPIITDNDFSALKDQIRKLTKEDLLVLAGSIPSTMPTTTYEELVKICSETGTRFVVDAEGDLLKKVLPYKPFLIKPNHHELGELFDTEISTCEEVIPYARKLVELGAENVIVSLASKGAVLVNNNGAWISNVPKGELRSSVGAGDSMVAGFLAAFIKNNSLVDAFKSSVATGSATAFSIGLCDKELVEDLLPQIHLQEILF